MGLGFGVLVLAAIYKCINTCPEILVTTGFNQEDPQFVVLYILYILLVSAVIAGFGLNCCWLMRYFLNRTDEELDRSKANDDTLGVLRQQRLKVIALHAGVGLSLAVPLGMNIASFA